MREAQKLAVVAALSRGAISTAEAETTLGVHRTTLWRLRKRYEKHGPEGLTHRLRGKPSNHRSAEHIRELVCDLYREEHAFEGTSVKAFWAQAHRRWPTVPSVSTVRRWLIAAGLLEPAKRTVARDDAPGIIGGRLECEMLVGDWLGTGDVLYLISITDAATDTALVADLVRATSPEALASAIDSVIVRHGLPMAICLATLPDGHPLHDPICGTLFAAPLTTEGRRALAEALDELGVAVVRATEYPRSVLRQWQQRFAFLARGETIVRACNILQALTSPVTENQETAFVPMRKSA